MVQPGMHGARIDEVSKSHLVNAAKTLIVGVRNDAEYERMVDRDKTIHRIVDDFPHKRHCCCVFVKALLRAIGKTTIAGFNNLNLIADYADDVDFADMITHCGETDADRGLFSRVLNAEVSDTTDAK
jgi:hypothetical protein